MIKKLDEHQKIKRIQHELDRSIEKDQAAYDGKEIPHSSDSEYECNATITDPAHCTTAKKAAVVDKYLDEGIRKKLLVSTTKEKTNQFREKRKQFEKHRKLEKSILDNRENYHSDFEDKHKLDLTGFNPYKRREKPLKSMITLVKSDGRHPRGYLEEL